MFLIAVFVVLIAVVGYWLRFRTWSNEAYSKSQMLVLIFMIALLALAHCADREACPC